jgi:hypothetical protein
MGSTVLTGNILEFTKAQFDNLGLAGGLAGLSPSSFILAGKSYFQPAVCLYIGLFCLYTRPLLPVY